MTWLIENNGTRWRLVTEYHLEFGRMVSITLYDGETLKVHKEALRTWK